MSEVRPSDYYPGDGGRPHPGPRAARISREIRDGIVEHARREVPNEACGIVIGDRAAAAGGGALRWVALRNPLASPYRYAIDPHDLLRLTIETDDVDEVFWAIVHSHVASPARPSPTDLREAHYPEALYLLVSLQAEPVIRAWRILDGGVHEVELMIDA